MVDDDDLEPATDAIEPSVVDQESDSAASESEVEDKAPISPAESSDPESVTDEDLI